jgi:urease subunit alpha
MFGSFGAAVSSTSLTFLSRAAVEEGVAMRLGLRKATVAVRGCRGLTKAAMINNSYCPRIEVDPETYEVRADGRALTCEPARVLPMAQRYFLF